MTKGFAAVVKFAAISVSAASEQLLWLCSNSCVVVITMPYNLAFSWQHQQAKTISIRIRWAPQHGGNHFFGCTSQMLPTKSSAERNGVLFLQKQVLFNKFYETPSCGKTLMRSRHEITWFFFPDYIFERWLFSTKYLSSGVRPHFFLVS